MIDIALTIAKKAHAGQVDKAGIDYIQHPLYVAGQVKTEQEKAVALLHDVIEDSDVTVDDLLVSGLSNEVVTAVQILTKKKGQSYQEYLEKVKSNNLARVVKLADLKHNSDLSRLKSVTDTDYERVKKYKNAIHYLSTQNNLGAFFMFKIRKENDDQYLGSCFIYRGSDLLGDLGIGGMVHHCRSDRWDHESDKETHKIDRR